MEKNARKIVQKQAALKTKKQNVQNPERLVAAKLQKSNSKNILKKPLPTEEVFFMLYTAF